MPDMARAGGITEMKKICAVAEAFGVVVSPHNYSSGVCSAATLHLMAATPRTGPLEWDTVGSAIVPGAVRRAAGAAGRPGPGAATAGPGRPAARRGPRAVRHLAAVEEEPNRTCRPSARRRACAYPRRGTVLPAWAPIEAAWMINTVAHAVGRFRAGPRRHPWRARCSAVEIVLRQRSRVHPRRRWTTVSHRSGGRASCARARPPTERSACTMTSGLIAARRGQLDLRAGLARRSESRPVRRLASPAARGDRGEVMYWQAIRVDRWLDRDAFRDSVCRRCSASPARIAGRRRYCRR